MSHPIGAPLRNQMGVAFVEADVEIGFNLVDMAESEHDSLLASRVIEEAETVFRDIEQRLQRAGDRDRASFEPLVQELRREIDRARQRNS